MLNHLLTRLQELLDGDYAIIVLVHFLHTQTHRVTDAPKTQSPSVLLVYILFPVFVSQRPTAARMDANLGICLV